MKHLPFVGTVKSHKVIMDFQDRYERYLTTLEGQRVNVEVKKFKKDRTPPQLKYYWAVPVRLISQHTGYEEEEVHSILKQMFLKCINKDGYEYVKSLSKMARQVDTVDMNGFIEAIQRWAAQELSLYIPDPNEEA